MIVFSLIKCSKIFKSSVAASQSRAMGLAMQVHTLDRLHARIWYYIVLTPGTFITAITGMCYIVLSSTDFTWLWYDSLLETFEMYLPHESKDKWEGEILGCGYLKVFGL